MKKLPTFLYSLSISVALQLSVTVTETHAGKLVAPPLPHEGDKDFANGQETIISPTASSFKRRPSKEEKEAEAKAAKEEQAKKDAAEAKARADAIVKLQQQRTDAYKEYLKTATDANNQAVQLGKQGRWAEAIEAHIKATQYNPREKQFKINLSAAYTAYGQQRMAAKDYNTAATLFRKALAAATDNGLAGKCLAEAIRKSGRDASSPDVRMQIGDQLASSNDLAGALLEYQAANQLESSARTLTKLGDIWLKSGMAAQANGYYSQALQKDPEYGPAYRQLAFVYMSAKDNTTAAAYLRKAVIFDKQDTQAGQYLIKLWRDQVAAAPLVAENHVGLAGAYQLTGDFQGADNEYRKVESLDPNNPSLETGRASLARAFQHEKAEKYKAGFTALFNQGLKKEALAEINQAVLLEPKNADYQYLLGEGLEAVGDYNGAHRAYLSCVLIDPVNNREAATRMKAMEQGAAQNGTPIQITQRGATSGSPAAVPSAVPTSYSSQSNPNYYQPAQNAIPQSTMQSTPVADSAANFSRQNMFEGGTGTPNLPASMNFRTHDESDAQQIAIGNAQNSMPANGFGNAGMAPSAQSGGAPAALAPAISPAAAAANDSLSRLNAAESQRDYPNAVAILRQMLNDNLQNPEMHHRLAANLLSAGEVSEAISEFRIASALNPKNKQFSDDLANAIAIHKKSLTNSGSGVTQ